MLRLEHFVGIGTSLIEVVDKQDETNASAKSCWQHRMYGRLTGRLAKKLIGT